MKSSNRVKASTRYQEWHTNEAVLRSRHDQRKWSTFSMTFSRTWSGKDWWSSSQFVEGCFSLSMAVVGGG
ncbi:hypothetical protein JHK82_027644 [Glycine max]|uniref:Uncharacterized protein n=2 Tax=Glycine subgen. Soja TaxID=1462606 RepID=K7LII8_SOYBN|nr:hypothetical protein JHK87_027535 [Glycine soja]KAG5003634.1 hypothetical protein JHK86_027773 [Glycine max]KAG5126809.1 hypothetical protein JHK82_027644 [Glycine max]KAG5151417.1 hypothetical protein JHK84_027889 [Glycine max]RZB86650.1 hypothetical protein D0Y65_026639 [Glycine soja]